MNNDFENIRAERDTERYQAKASPAFTGLWRQIALGIVVGYSVLSVLGFVGAMLWMKLMTSGIQLQIPN